MKIEAIIAQLEKALLPVGHPNSPAAAIEAATEKALCAVRAIDAVEAGASELRGQLLATVFQTPSGSRKSVAETVTALGKLKDETKNLEIVREVAIGIADQLAARAAERAAFEVERDEKRRPLREQTHRVDHMVKRFAEFDVPAKQIVNLFRDDVVASRLGAAAYSHLPAPPGAYVAHERTWRVPRALATEEVLSATKLPGHWPPGWRDSQILERPHFEEEDDEVIRPLRSLVKKGGYSQDEVDHAIARTQATLLAEYHKAAAKVLDLLNLDATITVADRELKYPDGAPVFDEAKFPPGWLIGRMRQRVQLPSIDGRALAAE